MNNISSQSGGACVGHFMSVHLQDMRLFDDIEDDDDDDDYDDDDLADDDDDDIAGVSNLEEFTSMLKEYFRLQRGAWIFRGHSSQAFKLIPKVGRTSHTSETRQQFELSIFNMFKRTALQHLQRAPTNDWEWLAIAQHHGLPTRLLDWSFNPLVALYFAVEDRLDQDGIVYALRVPKRLPQKRVDRGSPFKIEKPMKYLPNVVAPRLWVQEGLFIVNSSIDVPLTDDLRPDWKLESIVLPASAKQKLRYELYRIGVHRAALFPDLDGLTAHLQYQHGVHPDQIFDASLGHR